MTLDQIGQQCVKDSARWFPQVGGSIDQDIFFHTAAAMGELGEALNLIKKVVRGSLTYDEIDLRFREELADTFTYFMNVVGTIGLDIEAEYLRKRDINEKRFGDNHDRPEH